ncbi:MAG: SAM-dependent methyltransferase, partial [Stenotrophomonas maltophilia]|nr:SAM-dependent methyltransferase [Stenotrophomonas maltophilia]
MAFDQTTRNRLQRFVNDARRVLEEEFTRQLQNDYGMDPNAGTVAELASLRHINDAQRESARILRDTLAHYTASGDMNATQGLDRIVREQAFTVLNRLAALRMAEARGLLVESVGNGFQAKGFQLYARLAGTGLGETGDAYRTYLFSVFDELSQDLPGLFDRYSPQGRLFPREAALLQVLNLINDADIAPLWSEDETIGWIYQYFNSKEERKAMRDASQAPRNSRELAVRNQFFTPRYVVEFLVDNTLGRLWFNATGGDTDLREHCQYLLVKPDEMRQAATKLRDPRTLKLLDPAC